jgi:peptidoglycan/LPS O-acetylase OafA/YrhL
MATSTFLPQLTFTRFIAAFFVVAFHFGQQAWPFQTYPLSAWTQEGGLGVGFFFVLSGFVLMWVYAPQAADRPGRAYWMARIARILPVYLATFLVSLLIVMFVRHEYPRGLSIILQALGLHAWVPGYALSINFPGWSVSVEIFFYLCFPFLLPWARRMPVLWMGGLIALLYAGTQLLYHNFATWMPVIPGDGLNDFALRFPPWHLPAFLIGILAARLTRTYLDAWKGMPGLLMAIAASAAILVILATSNALRSSAGGGLLAPLFGVLVMGIALLPDAPARILGHPALVYLGEISFGIYLLQCPVYMIWEGILGLGQVSGNLFWPYFLTLVAAAAFSYWALEQPARAWLRKR